VEVEEAPIPRGVSRDDPLRRHAAGDDGSDRDAPPGRAGPPESLDPLAEDTDVGPILAEEMESPDEPVDEARLDACHVPMMTHSGRVRVPCSLETRPTTRRAPAWGRGPAAREPAHRTCSMRYRPNMIPRRPGRPLGVGIQLPEVEREVRWPELRAIARTAEQVGLDSIWLGDHLLYRYDSGETRGPWEAWTTLAGLAEATERVALGPLVAATAFHSPFMLAKQAATVDEISGGRLVLGIGAGWNPVEFAALGAPFDHRVSRFEEAFTIVRTLLAEGAIDFEGEFFSARDAELLPRSARPGGPPILIGSSGPRMLAATILHVAAWNAWYADTENSPGGVPALRDVVDGAARAAGRDPGEIERTVAVQVRMPGGTGRVMGDTSERQSIVPLQGTPEQLAEELRAYAREGIGHVQLVVDPITEASVAALAPALELLDRG